VDFVGGIGPGVLALLPAVAMPPLLGWGALCRARAAYRAMERRARQQEAKAALLSSLSGDVVLLLDADGTQREASASAAAVLGYAPAELVGHDWAMLLHPEERPGMARLLMRLRHGAEELTTICRGQRRDSTPLWLEAHVRTLRDGAGDGMVVALRDITRSRRATDALAADGQTDPLTGLATRARLEEALAAEWARSNPNRQPLSLLRLEVDDFTAYQDRYGRDQADAVLRLIANSIATAARRVRDLGAQLGWAGFAVLLPGTPKVGALHVAETITQAVADAAIPFEGSPAGVVTLSVGCACTPAQSPAALSAAAEAALRVG
jgi:diguanylate cyclase (GGDEF)-like protein/PAS domain S-box-containing protein